MSEHDETLAAQGLTEGAEAAYWREREAGRTKSDRGGYYHDGFLAARQSRDEAAIWHEGWIAGASRRMSTDNPYHAARLTDTAAPEGLHACIGCGVELDGDDPNDRCDECPAAPAAGEGVETVERIREAFWRCFQPDFGGYDWRNDAAIQTFARTIAPLLRSPVEPETSEPEGGDRDA